MSKNGWIAVDLDGTLAQYNGWVSESHIGDPVPAMADRVRQWLAEGHDVRIFTARVDGGEVAIAMGNPAGEAFRDVTAIRAVIQDWTEQHFGVRLPVTNAKDYGMLELWDDRAVQVIPNAGARVDDAITDAERFRWLLDRIAFHRCAYRLLQLLDIPSGWHDHDIVAAIDKVMKEERE